MFSSVQGKPNNASRLRLRGNRRITFYQSTMIWRIPLIDDGLELLADRVPLTGLNTTVATLR